jgi:GNAT superfamily N-acetyltransferase
MPLTIRPIRFPEDAEALARLCWGYRDLLAARCAATPAIVDAYYSEDSYAALIDDLPRIHARPAGDILLAELDGLAVGCAMYYPLDLPTTCEIKRVFVEDSARGHGAGKALMRDAMQRARADGYDRMVLDTMYLLTEAIALYEALGFAPCPPFYTPEPAFAPILRFYDHPL